MSIGLARKIGAAWGVIGVVLLLVMAIIRLTPHATQAVQIGLEGWQWVLLALWCVFMVASEGYDGFQKRLAPRITERARVVRERGGWLEIILAPVYVFGYFRAPRRQLVTSYIVLGLIICAVVVVHQLPQPWRGMIDAGVVLGLGYGLMAIVVAARRTV